MNFVEHRKDRERNLAKACDLWEDVRTKIEECCNSFNQHYRVIGDVECVPVNGHSIKITVTFTGGTNPPPVGVIYPKRTVRITFSETKPSIHVTVDANPVRAFLIDADDSHCFILQGASEIDIEKFAALALEDAFFNVPPGRPQAS